MPTLHDGNRAFEVTLLGPADSKRVVLFAAGRGGDPSRHGALLHHLAASGCKVIAPRFELIAPTPSAEAVAERGRMLQLALGMFADGTERVLGVGHSIGASLLLGLAGATLTVISRETVELSSTPALHQLVLLAPALDFVAMPGALAAVNVPAVVWSGTMDELSPPSRAQLIEAGIGARASVVRHVIEGANHFSIMDMPPPHTSESLSDRDGVLRGMHTEIARLAANGPCSAVPT
jgi:pimeloyl-ACP methyl ester carboxylesterase